MTMLTQTKHKDYSKTIEVVNTLPRNIPLALIHLDQSAFAVFLQICLCSEQVTISW